MQNSLNRTSVVTAAAATGAAGVIVFALLPIFIGQIADRFHLSEADSGVTAAAYFVIYALVSLTTPLWIRRISWRVVALIGYGVMVIGLIALLLSGDHTMVLVSLAITGAGAATLLPISLTLVSDMLHTERVYAITISVQQLIPALLLFGISAGLLGTYALGNTIYAAIAITLACVLLSYDLPAGDKSEQAAAQGTSSPPLALLSLLGLALNFAGFAAMWAFFEIIAGQAGLTDEFSSRWIAVGLLMTAVGPLVAAWLSDRIGRLIPLTVPTAIAAAATVFLSGGVTESTYALALVIFPLGYYIALSYVLSIIADADPDGTYSSLMSFALAFGAIAGPAIYGYAREVGSSEVAVITFFLFSGAAILAWIQRRIFAATTEVI